MARGRTVSVGGGGRSLALLLVVTMVLSVAGIGLTGTAGANTTEKLNYGEDAADELWIDVDTLTVARHPMEHGGTHADMAGYVNDEGDWVSDPVFVVNDSIGEDTDDDELGNRNPYTYNPAYIDDEDFGAFPRRGSDEDDPDTDASASDDNLASALDASEWSETANASAAAPADTSIATDVDAVNFDTGTSLGTGNYYTAKYDNWTAELDSDETRRVIQLSGEVNSIEAGTRAYINITDESGDYKRVEFNGSSSATVGGATVATSSGTFWYQEELSNLSTTGGGTWDNIESIKFNSTEGDIDVSFSRIDLESKGKDSYGEEVYDGNDDDTDYDDERDVYEGTGTLSVHEMSTLGAEYDDAVINDVDFPAKFRVQDLATSGEEEGYLIEWSTSDKYSRSNVLEAHYRLELPDAIDLSYAGTDLMMEQAWPEARYVTLEYQEGAGGDNFTSITDDDEWTDLSSNLGSEDNDISLDSTITSGTEYAIHVKSTFSDDEKASLEVSSDTDAAGGGAGGQEPGGPFAFIGGTFNAAVAAVGGAALFVLRLPQKAFGMLFG